MRPRAALFLFALLAIAVIPFNANAVYRVAVEQLQPETPYPGDTVVFKVTLLNEASWSSVLYAEVVSPDGIIYSVDTIRTRAGNYLPNTEYVSFTIPENALPGNYTLSLRSHDYIYNEARFYVFEKQKAGLYVETSFRNNTLTLNISSPTLIRGLGVELLDQLPQVIEQNGNTSKTAFLPASYRPLGQSYRYLGDVANATVSFSIAPLEGYVQIPVMLRWQDGEKIITWSGYAERPTPSSDAALQNEDSFSPRNEAPENKRPRMSGYALPIAAFLLVLPSVLLWARRRNGGVKIHGAVRSILERRSRLFEGSEEEAGQKWAFVAKCIEELRFSAGEGMIKASALRRELGRKLSAREVADILDYLVGKGDLREDGEHYVVERWKEK